MNIQVRHPICHVFIFALMQTAAIQLQAAPEMTKEKFDTFPEAVGGGFAYEKGVIYSVKGKIVQVGPDWVQVESLLDGESFGMIKITPEFLENFPGQKGTMAFFLSEFTGYANLPTRIGGSIRLAIFNASHYLPLDGSSIQIVDKKVAEKVAGSTTGSGAVSLPKTSDGEGDKPMRSDSAVDPKTRILGEWVNETRAKALVTTQKMIFQKDGVFEHHMVLEHTVPILKSSDKTVVSPGKWTVTEGQIYVDYIRRFGNSENDPPVKFKIILKDAKTIGIIYDDGSEGRDLYTYQQGVKSGDVVSAVNGVEPMKSDDGTKIKIAELKGELAVVDQKIEAERKRWIDASDVINRLTNNRTRPVIRNSPEHQKMYEAQLIMKDVEEKAPGLKEQKTKIEATLEALE